MLSNLKRFPAALLSLLAGMGTAMSDERSSRAHERAEMVAEIAELAGRIENELGRDRLDARVMAVMREVPRHEFVPEDARPSAYRNRPLSIGHGQTISQPFIVALMTDLLQVKPTDRVLEVGTGSGYQAAVLARLVAHVYSIEIVAPLTAFAREALARVGIGNVSLRVGDGYEGWPDAAPFDAIIVTAAPDHVPPRLVEQLKPGGRMVIPVGGMDQDLKVIEKAQDGTAFATTVIPVRFVPLVRERTGR